jgi:hypothetical protein
MLFEDKKLQLESVDELIQCPILSVEPFSLMLAPVYVLMKLNKKLVSVKAPLDFFTREELDRLKSHEVFYMPKFAVASLRFQTAARVVQNILSVKQGKMAPAPYELSGETFAVMGPLWGKQVQIEPFFMCVFAEELCSPLKAETMLWARENAVVRHDHALLLSGSLVFVALHLGWLNLVELNQFRHYVYEKTVAGESWESPKSELELIVCELNDIFSSNTSLSVLNLKAFNSEWSKKLSSRLERLIHINTNKLYESVSIYGEEGFAS